MLSDRQAIGEDTVATPDHAPARHPPPSGNSLPRHLARGAIGFGLIGCALALSASVGPAALLLFAPAMVALRGCPTCWIMGLAETLSAGRLERTCTGGGAGTCTPTATNCRLSHNQHGPFE